MSGVISGGILVGIGIVFLLDRMDMLGGHSAWNFWPLILVFIGLVKLFPTRDAPSRVEGLLMIAAGAVVQLNYLDIVDLEWNMIWPAALIVIGVFVGWSAWHRSRHRQSGSPHGGSTSSYVSGTVIFGGREDEIDSKEFEGGDLMCMMGGFDLDLRNADIKGEEALINIRLVMGGVELKVPDTWSVVVQGIPIMGAFENKTRLAPTVDSATAKRLIIRGSVLMGGVEIRN